MYILLWHPITTMGIPSKQANIIGARWFAYVKKSEELDSIKIVSTR